MAYDPAPGAKYGVRAFQGDTLILDLDEWSQDLVSDIESKMTGYMSGTAAARAGQTALDGLLFRETDTGKVYVGTGTVWIQIAGPRTTNQGHAWTLDDATQINPSASKVASFPVYPATGETVKLIGALILCDTVGGTASTFKIQTDITTPGTYVDVTGLTSLSPAPGAYVFVAASSPPTFPNPGPRGVRIVCNNPGVGTSKGIEVVPVTQHTI